MFGRRSTLRTSKLAQRKRRRFLLRIFFLGFLIVALLGGGLYLVNREEIKIQSIVFEGTDTVREASLHEVITEELSGKYFFIVPRSSTLFYPKADLEARVLSSFKRIKRVDTKLDNLTTLRVRVEERRPQSLWCGDDRFEVVTSQCYFVDENGVLFTRAPSFSDNVYFRFYGPINDGDPTGQSLFPENTFHEFSFFLTSLREFGLEPRELVIREDDDYELFFESGFRVLFSKDQVLSVVLDNLQSVVSSEDFEAHDRVSIDYIDLRFGNKVYYRLKE